MCGLLAFLIGMVPACTGLNNQRPDPPANLPEQGDCSNYSNAQEGSQTRGRFIRQEFIQRRPTPMFRPAPAAGGQSMTCKIQASLGPRPGVRLPVRTARRCPAIFCPSKTPAPLVPCPYGSPFYSLALYLRFDRQLQRRVHLLRPC